MITYRRAFDGLLMVEVARHQAVNVLAARKLGLIAAGLRFAEPDREGGAAVERDAEPPAPIERPRKARPTDAEFEELKRKRDAAVAEVVDRVCAEQGWDRSKVGMHASHAGECYCACPDGPCQHIWDGPDHEEECMSSVTCSRFGSVAAYHDMRVMP